MTNYSDLGSSSAASTEQTGISDKGIKPGAKAKVKVVMTATMKRRALKPKKSKLKKF